MAVLRLRCCSRAFSNWGEQRILLSVCDVWAFHWSGVSCCGAQALECGFSSCREGLSGMWNLPRPGIELMSLHWQADSYPLDHQGSPYFIFVYFIFIYVDFT